MNSNLIVFCDGGARGNPGPAAAAFVVEEAGQEIYSNAFYLGPGTNNVAEYHAVLEALTWLSRQRNLLNKKTVFILDSELVTKQINGLYKVKNRNLKKYFLAIKKILGNLTGEIIFRNVSREKNRKADFLVNKKLDSVS